MNARMGQFVQEYQPRLNLHRLINDVTTAPRYAFPPSAIVTQEKKLPDVSFYQGVINWDAMRRQTDAVIVRAGQGAWIDKQFMRNWTVARRLGMKRGIYWFYDDRVSPGEQASRLESLIRDDLPELEIWCDWENSYGGAFGGLRNVVAFMQRVESLLPDSKVGMYTGYWWLREHSNAITNAAQYNYLKTHDLWLAWYSTDAASVLIPAPWTSLLYWQFGTPSEGHQYGVETIEIDMNYFNGTQADFDTRYGAVTLPPVTGDPMSDYYDIVGTDGHNHRVRLNHDVRSAHLVGRDITNSIHARAGTSPDDVYIFPANVTDPTMPNGLAAKAGDIWRKVYQVGNELVIGWTAEKHMGVMQGISIRLVHTNPPPEPEPAEDTIEVYVNGVLKVSGPGRFTVS